MSNEDNKLIVIKFGGAVVADDSEFEKYEPEKTEDIIRILKEKADKYRYIIVHGGGSFGHYHAKDHSLNDGFTENSQIKGVYDTHESMLKLNKLILGSFKKAENITPITFVPMSSCIACDGRIENFAVDPIRKALELGFTPVLFGDVVFDSKKGFTIISGDQIVPYLAIKLKADRIIMLTDVDGVYNENPNLNLDAELLSELNLNDDKILDDIAENALSGKTRVTGEIEKKLIELRPAVEKRINTKIISGMSPEPLRKVLEGNESIGTNVIFKLEE